jgi:hypothetical protein
MLLVATGLVPRVADTTDKLGESASFAGVEAFPERLGGKDRDVVGGEVRIVEVVTGNEALGGSRIAGLVVGGVLH